MVAEGVFFYSKSSLSRKQMLLLVVWRPPGRMLLLYPPRKYPLLYLQIALGSILLILTRTASLARSSLKSCMNWPSMTASRKGGSGSTRQGVVGAGRECILRERVLQIRICFCPRQTMWFWQQKKFRIGSLSYMLVLGFFWRGYSSFLGGSGLTSVRQSIKFEWTHGRITFSDRKTWMEYFLQTHLCFLNRIAFQLNLEILNIRKLLLFLRDFRTDKMKRSKFIHPRKVHGYIIDRTCKNSFLFRVCRQQSQSKPQKKSKQR